MVFGSINTTNGTAINITNGGINATNGYGIYVGQSIMLNTNSSTYSNIYVKGNVENQLTVNNGTAIMI